MIYTLSKVAYLLIFPKFMRRDAYQLFSHIFLLHSTLHKSWSFYHFKVELKPVIAWKMDSLAKNPFPFTKDSLVDFLLYKTLDYGDVQVTQA